MSAQTLIWRVLPLTANSGRLTFVVLFTHIAITADMKLPKYKSWVIMISRSGPDGT